MELVTPQEAKREAAKGLKEAIAVGVKKFECLLSLTCNDIRESEINLDNETCGLCIYYGWLAYRLGKPNCKKCILCLADKDCYEQASQFHFVLDARVAIRNETETTTTQFRKETRKMIKILKKLYREVK